MTDKEYYYNLELLELLENLIKIIPGSARSEDYFMSYIDNLKERLDKMLDEERKESNDSN